MSTIVSILLILSSVGIFFGYVDPKNMNIKVNTVKKQDYDKTLANSHELQAERDKLLAKLNSFQDTDINELNKLIPDNIDNVRFIIDVDNIAQQYGMHIRNFKTEVSTKQDKQVIGRDTSAYGTLSMTFSTTASYESFLAFIKNLESSLRLIDVVGIDFSSPEFGNIYDFSVNIRTYWLK